MREYKDIPESEKWYTVESNAGTEVLPQFAIVDGEGYTVIGMTRMSEQTACNVCHLHNLDLIT